MSDTLVRAAQDSGTQAELSGFLEHLNSLPAYRAARINPFEFAADAGIPAAAALDLFIHGARLGVFDLEWGSICPLCGAIMHTAVTLDHIAEDTLFCTLCQRNVDSVLDDTVEVTFAHIDADPVDLHADFRAYQHYHTSSAFPYREQWRRYHEKHFAGAVTLGPGETGALKVDLLAGESYRMTCMDTHAGAILHAGQGDVTAFVLNNGDLSPHISDVPAGPATFTVTNATDQPVWIRVMHTVMEDIKAILDLGPAQFGERLTGKRLINSQTFRDCFEMRELAPDLKLKLRSLTLLFTDLKGSTALYDREGDLAAYRLVQDHFAALKSVVRQNSGAMIKTMGDAVMAAFPSSQSGTVAAIGMMAAMQKIAGGRSDDVGLKIGLHAGPALAINAEGAIDYFGQTVNIAARVQGLADAGDICITGALNSADSVADLLRDAGYTGSSEMSRLKGVSATEEIFRYRAM